MGLLFLGAISRFPLNLLRRTSAQKDIVAIGARHQFKIQNSLIVFQTSNESNNVEQRTTNIEVINQLKK